MFKDFKSPDGTERRVVCDCSIIVIGDQWQKVPESLWQASYAEGCVSKDMFDNEALKKVPKNVQVQIQKAHAKQEMILNEVRRMVVENEMDSFDTQGRPKILVLKKNLGFSVSGGERDKALHDVKNELIEE